MTEEQTKTLQSLFPDEAVVPPRPSWDEYFMDLAEVIAKRSTCLRRQVGAIIVEDKHILATGYNGAPRGIANCWELGSCLRQETKVPSGERHELCRGSHAEQNAITQAAYHGVKIAGASIYCTHMPCIICAKMIINAGLRRIVFKNFYPDDLAMQMLNESKIKLDLFKR
ncbi:deoxycytidylate deaminase [Candidatus Termititenax persephonae]|uniref:Deoxycytidylate deaminase n=1 Tax=Candidatus Termititenax persephonae TaxID=2218525 RepID=A0A388TIA3_9BACT|nr:deoxycytidylate deaminase [Candidatus Termititenax persephonae]